MTDIVVSTPDIDELGLVLGVGEGEALGKSIHISEISIGTIVFLTLEYVIEEPLVMEGRGGIRNGTWIGTLRTLL